MPKYPDRELLAVRDDVRRRAEEHGRVFRRQDLVAWGLPSDTVVPMVRRDWWVRLHHGVYTDVRDLASTPEARSLIHLAASIRALSEPAYAFGTSAARLHGLALPRDLPLDVHLVRERGREGRSLTRRVTGRDRLSPPSLRTHHLRAEDVTTVHGIPTVVAELAAVSAGVVCSDDWAVAVMDSAAWQRSHLIEEMARHAQALQHLSGIGTVRGMLRNVRSGAQTPLETHSRLRLIRCGLPEPQLQVPFYDDEGLIGYVDMYFEELGVIGEADGLIKYRTGHDLIQEKYREDRLRRIRPVVRWGWDRMWTDPHAIARQIRQASTWRRAG